MNHKTKMKTTPLIHHHVITGTLSAGTILFLVAGASGQTLYDSDLYTGAINVFNSAGKPTTFVPSTESLSQEIAFNSSGYLFVGNTTGPSITEISPAGMASSFGSGLNQPRGVAVDNAGDVFVANFGSGQIIEVSPNGTSQSVFASGLDEPAYLIFNSAGDLFEADGGTGNIYEFANGTRTLYASGFQHPDGLAFNRAGDLFVANALNAGYISEVTPSGTSTVLSGLNVPQGVAFDNAGDLFIAIGGAMTGAPNGEIEEITSTGTTETFSTQVSTPEGLAFSPVPEPSTLALLAVGASAVALRLRRKQ
jgi:hypothetical protein